MKIERLWAILWYCHSKPCIESAWQAILHCGEALFQSPHILKLPTLTWHLFSSLHLIEHNITFILFSPGVSVELISSKCLLFNSIQ